MLTKENYFSLNNKALTNSKIKTYLQCPNYFYRLYISGEVEKEFKKAFNIGDAVDNILTQRDEMTNYAVCEAKRTTKEGKKEAANLEFAGKTVISRTDYNLIVNIADAVIKTSAYAEILKNFVFQEILETPADLGEHFKVLAGRPDAYRINSDGVCDLLDLKTTINIDPDKFYYSAISYGYFKQLWIYAFLLKVKYPEIKSFRYWHLAVEKKEPYRVELFSIPNKYVDDCEQDILETIQKIATDKEFKKKDASFKSPTPLIRPGSIILDDEWEEA